MDLEAREGIRELKYEYIHALDEPNVERFVELFTGDATFTAGTYGTVTGRDGIREFIEYRADDERAYHHMATNPVIEVDGDVATGRWYYIVIKVAEDGPAEWGQGTYQDAYRRVDGDWMIVELEARRNYTLKM
jgi:ketosteroid isomerase-like protein